MSRFMKAMVVIILTVTLGLGSLWATGGVYDAYKQTFGDARLQTKLNAFIDACNATYTELSGRITNLNNMIANWVGTDSYLMLIQQTPIYVDGDTFTVPGDYTSRLTVGKQIQVDLGTDGLKPNSVASSSYADGVTTVNLNTSNLTSNLRTVYVAATRDGNWPNGPGYVMAEDYGSPSRATLVAADAVAVAAGKQLHIGPGTWTIDQDTTITSPLKVMPGAVLSVANTVTLTLNGTTLDAGTYQIINCLGTGKVEFGSIKTIYAEWFKNPQKAIDSLMLGGVVKFTSTCLLDSGLTVTTDGITLEGLGITKINASPVVLKANAAMDAVVTAGKASPDDLRGFQMRNIEIDGNSLATYGVKLNRNIGYALDRVKTINCTDTGIYNGERTWSSAINQCISMTNGSAGLRLGNTANSFGIHESTFSDQPIGILIDPTVGVIAVVTIDKCTIESCSGIGIDANAVWSLNIINSYFEQLSGSIDIRLGHTVTLRGVNITGNNFSGQEGIYYGVHIERCRALTIGGNRAGSNYTTAFIHNTGGASILKCVGFPNYIETGSVEYDSLNGFVFYMTADGHVKTSQPFDAIQYMSGVYWDIKRDGAGQTALNIGLTGESNPRIAILSDRIKMGNGTNAPATVIDNNQAFIPQGIGPKILAGSGTPEGAKSAPVGSIYLRSEGSAGTSLYVKESGTGNTGWVAK